MPQLWAGVDAGKSHHHCVVIDNDGKRLLSKRIPNDENSILELIADVCALVETAEISWATDMNRGAAALLISILTAHAQPVIYLPGRTVNAAAQTYRGNGKTDAKDAAIIADQARMRRDIQPLRTDSEISSSLRLLCSHRGDLVADRTRSLNRLRATLLEYFPALEAAFDYSNTKAALVLLTRHQTAETIRRHGTARLAAWLKKNHCRNSAEVAERAVAAAHAQQHTVTAHETAARIAARLATDVLRLHAEIEHVEAQIEARFREHADAELLLSVPGIGPRLGAEFVATTGGDMSAYEGPDRLAGIAGLAPAPRDSGRISGNHHRPRRYDRRLLRTCFLAAQIAARICPASRAYYERKRAEGKTFKQAILALARRRMNVIWAILRDRKPYELQPLNPTTPPAIHAA